MPSPVSKLAAQFEETKRIHIQRVLNNRIEFDKYKEAWRLTWRTMRIIRKTWKNDHDHFGYKKGQPNLTTWSSVLILGLLEKFHFDELEREELFLAAHISHNNREKGCRLGKCVETKFQQKYSVMMYRRAYRNGPHKEWRV